MNELEQRKYFIVKETKNKGNKAQRTFNINWAYFSKYIEKKNLLLTAIVVEKCSKLAFVVNTPPML